MGRLIDGQWSTEWYTPDDRGRFVRQASRFRGRVCLDGTTPHPVESGRYHLFASYACPWAHRTLIVRRLRCLQDAVSISIVDPHMTEDGWHFSAGPGCIPDTLYGSQFLREIYLRADPQCTGRVTVPVLWDKELQTIVNNESVEIAKMFDGEMRGLGDPDITFYPASLRQEIDAALAAIYEPINNGVYRAGFATRQKAYEEAVVELFCALEHWDKVLGERRFMCGDRLTLADWCLFTTLYRFDAVYHYHFKCNLRRVSELPNLRAYVRKLHALPGVAETCRMDHIKQHYYRSHPSVNPSGIVPLGPSIDF